MNTALLKLGQRISELRQKRGITQEKLAELVHYSPNHISKLESARTNPSFDLLVKIAVALDVELNELFNFSAYKTDTEIKNKLHNIIDKTDKNELKTISKVINAIYNT